MRQPPSPASPSRAQMRERWLERAAAAFDQMFDDARQDQLVTFDQREACACSFGEELAAWLLEQHVAADPCVRPPADQAPVCPKCGRPGQRVTPAEHTLPLAATNDLDRGRHLAREQWRCRAGRGVHEAGWHETKVACCLTLAAATHTTDPQPEPPSKFLDPVQVARLAAELEGPADALHAKGSVKAWRRYERWLRWAWSGQVAKLLQELRAGCRQLGTPPTDAARTTRAGSGRPCTCKPGSWRNSWPTSRPRRRTRGSIRCSAFPLTRGPGGQRSCGPPGRRCRLHQQRRPDSREEAEQGPANHAPGAADAVSEGRIARMAGGPPGRSGPVLPCGCRRPQHKAESHHRLPEVPNPHVRHAADDDHETATAGPSGPHAQ